MNVNLDIAHRMIAISHELGEAVVAQAKKSGLPADKVVCTGDTSMIEIAIILAEGANEIANLRRAVARLVADGMIATKPPTGSDN